MNIRLGKGCSIVIMLLKRVSKYILTTYMAELAFCWEEDSTKKRQGQGENKMKDKSMG
jgi:hypothetical protein